MTEIFVFLNLKGNCLCSCSLLRVRRGCILGPGGGGAGAWGIDGRKPCLAASFSQVLVGLARRLKVFSGFCPERSHDQSVSPEECELGCME